MDKKEVRADRGRYLGVLRGDELRKEATARLWEGLIIVRFYTIGV